MLKKNSINSSRLTWVDTIKGFGIFLVVLGHHELKSDIAKIWIYSFHMPLFFFLSGMFAKKKESSKLIIGKIRSLIIPYFIFSIFLFLVWFLLTRRYGNDAGIQYSVSKNLLGIFYSQNCQWMLWGVPMWFLTCLFVVSILYHYILAIAQRQAQIVVFILCGVVGYLYTVYLNIRLPWSIDIAFVAVVFFFVGNLYHRYLCNLEMGSLKRYLLLSLLLCINILIGMYNGKVDMYIGNYGNQALFYVSAFSGIFFAVLLFRGMNSTLLAYLGRNSLLILILHGVAETVTKGIRVYIMNETLSDKESIIQAILISMIQLVMLVPVIEIINRYFPIFLGKIKGKE